MNIPAISGTKLIQCLVKKFGFTIVRQKGSHVILKHADGRTLTIPCHNSEDLGKGLLIKIIKKDARLSIQDFLKVFSILALINS